MSDQTGSTEAGAAAPPPAEAPDVTGQQQETTADTSATASNKTNKEYGVFTELSLSLGSAQERKASAEQLAELVHASAEGKITVLVRMGNVIATEPKKALGQLGQHRELDGDYEVIAATSRNKFEKVKTKKEVVVSIG